MERQTSRAHAIIKCWNGQPTIRATLWYGAEYQAKNTVFCDIRAWNHGRKSAPMDRYLRSTNFMAVFEASYQTIQHGWSFLECMNTIHRLVVLEWFLFFFLLWFGGLWRCSSLSALSPLSLMVHWQFLCRLHTFFLVFLVIFFYYLKYDKNILINIIHHD